LTSVNHQQTDVRYSSFIRDTGTHWSTIASALLLLLPLPLSPLLLL
jgi:hypothetical protein